MAKAAKKAPQAKKAPKGAPKAKPAQKTAKKANAADAGPRKGSKSEKVLALLQRSGGATLTELMKGKRQSNPRVRVAGSALRARFRSARPASWRA